MSDLRNLVHDAAGAAPAQLDFEAAIRQAHQIRIRRRLTRAVGAVGLVVVLALAAPTALRQLGLQKVETADQPKQGDLSLPGKDGLSGDGGGAGGPVSSSRQSGGKGLSGGSGVSGRGRGAALLDPTGERIAYVRGLPRGNYDIYVMDADGSNLKSLTQNQDGGATRDLRPSWSPDGKRIAFTRTRNTKQVYTMNSDGSSVVQVTRDDPSTSLVETAFSPSWGPDGRLVYARMLCPDPSVGSGPCGGLHVFNFAEGQETTIFTSPHQVEFPAWSPDGRSVAFALADGRGSDIMVVGADGGTGGQRLTEPDRFFDLEPAWSPDSRRLLFASNREGAYHLFAMNYDGSAQSRLTNDSQFDSEPGWSTAGTLIAFARDPDGSNPSMWCGSFHVNVDYQGHSCRPQGGVLSGAIWIMSSDGSSQRKITSGDFLDSGPAFRPRR